MKRLALVFIAIFAALLPTLRAQTTVTFTPTAAFRIGSDFASSAPTDIITAFQSNTPQTQNSILLFDLSSLAGTTITSATLTLTTLPTGGLNNGNNSGAGATNIYRVADNWVSGQVNWSLKATGLSWTHVGGEFVGSGGVYLTTPYAFNNTAVASAQQVTLTFDLTALVQEWANGTANNGLGLSPENINTQLGFYISGGSGPSLSVTAIPEPSTYAAIFGALALGAAGVRGYRRRKRATAA